MLGLAFKNPEMTFFRSYTEKPCSTCGTKTKEFFFGAHNSMMCMGCFSLFESTQTIPERIAKDIPREFKPACSREYNFSVDIPLEFMPVDLQKERKKWIGE